MMGHLHQVYDSVWSFGQWCATALCMKKLGLRSASGPFDWLGQRQTIGAYVDQLTAGFSEFFLRENMKKLGDVPGEGTEHWKDMKRGWESRHEFKVGVPFEENYAKYRALVDRRSERLFAALRAGGRVLFIHWFGEGHYPREEVIAAMHKLRASFPDTKIDLLVIETEKFAKGVAYEEPEPGVVFAIGDFYDQKRFDAVMGNEPLALSVLGRIRMRGRWRNLLHVRIESLRKRIGRLVSGRRER